MKEITSAANPLVKRFKQLQTPSGRKAHGLFLAEGEHLCVEALRSGSVELLLISKGHLADFAAWLPQDQEIVLISGQVEKALADSRTPQGCLAVCALPRPRPLSEAGPRLMALNRLQDPGNLGAILRTLDAAAFDGLIIDAGCADPWSPKAVRAAMGASFRVPVYAVDSLPGALAGLSGYALVAGDLNGSPYYSHPPFPEKVCLLVGNEGAGLDGEVLRLADYRLKLPIPGGAESLNAAVAAGLMVYDLLRSDGLDGGSG